MPWNEALFKPLDEVDWRGSPPTRELNAFARAGMIHVVDVLLVQERAGHTMGSNRTCYVQDRPDSLRRPNYGYRGREHFIQRTKRLSRVRVLGYGPPSHQAMLARLKFLFGIDADLDLVDFPWDRLGKLPTA
jgi:hypothetical protein